MLTSYSNFIKKNNLPQCEFAIIMGSGLGECLTSFELEIEIPFNKIKGMPNSSVAGHKSKFLIGKLSGKQVVIMSGRLHAYENFKGSTLIVPYNFMQQLGVKTCICTNAVGAVNENYNVGDLVAIKDQIMLAQNPLCTIETNERPVFIPMAECYDATALNLLTDIAKKHEINLHQGVYCHFSGPSYETKQEIVMARQLGGDVVGMSGGCETILLNYLNVKVLMISIISNMASGLSKNTLSHEEVLTNVKRAHSKLNKLISEVVKKL